MGRHRCVDPEHDIDHEIAATLREECQQAMDLEFVKLRTENIFHLPTTPLWPVSLRSVSRMTARGVDRPESARLVIHHSHKNQGRPLSLPCL